MKLTPQQRAEYKVRLRAMTPKQLAEHKARLKALSCEIVEDATKYATLFLWCQGIRVTRDAPASLRRIALEREIDLSDATYPPKSIGADPAFDEFIRKFHEKLIDCVLLGWRGAGDILCDFADRLMTEGEPLPPWLGKYLVWAARGDGEALRKGRRGQDPYGNVNRDFAIATAVRLISDLSGLNPTRGEATAYAEKAESGCSVVAKALKDLGEPRMSEKNVVAIWGASKKGRSPFALVDHARTTGFGQTQADAARECGRCLPARGGDAMTANLLEDPIDWPGLIKDPIQCAVIHLSWWMPLDASAGRCNIFDVALMICDGNPFSLRPELQSIVREELVAEALYGSRLAHEALCNAAMVLIKEGSSLPPWLGRYLVIVAAEGKKASSKKGPKRQPNSVRDMAIWYVVGLIAKCYRLDHTRNVATTEKESACSIVAKARERLKVDLLEASVNTIWGSCAGRMSLARMEATTAAHRMRTACASIARCVGDREWLKKHDTRELARSWRRAESARCSPHAQSRRKKKVHAPAC